MRTIRNWILKEQGNDEKVSDLEKALGIHPALATLLVQRGINSYDEAKAFFRPKLEDLHDPFLMQDMDKAVSRVDRAIKQEEKILVYGDYDVDGTTSVAMVYTFLKKLHDPIDFYIPDRYSEGYGVSITGIEHAIKTGVRLVIALDCGIKAVDKVDLANKNNIDFIICDHHHPGEHLPDAYAVLDPKRPDCNYPYKELSGCGVGYKLLQAFSIRHKIPNKEIESYLDLLAVSIASDIVPVTGENRILAYYGLKRLNKSPGTGLKKIIEIAEIRDKEITIEDIVFKIGPRINAAGRMESGKSSVDLLIARDDHTAQIMSEKVDDYNYQRRNIDSNITVQALEQIANSPEMKNRKTTVLFNPQWHKGVIGIVASRLIERYYRPTVILTESNGFATGSARSVFGFDLYAAVEACGDLLENFGGHKYAAGLTLKIENVPKFTSRFEAVVSGTITPEQLVPVVEIDTEIKLTDISLKFYRVLKQFQPFGPENMSPVFLTENVVDNGAGKTVGHNGGHLKLSLIQEEDPYYIMPAIAFHQGHHFKQISNGHAFDVCYTIEENEYMGKQYLQLNIKDLKTD